MNKFYRYLNHAPAPAAGTRQTISRRGLLMVATGGSLTLALLPADALIADTTNAPEKGKFQPTIWYEIRDDGRILINIAEAEMGQHVGTALARIVADELEADWSQVELHHVDSDPKWGLMVTGGSWSVWQNFTPLSQAGAAGRMVLVEAGAELLGVTPQDCQARDSQVIVGNRSISYAEIVSRMNISRSFSEEELADMPVKPATERRLIGKQTPALDVPAKTNGEGRYGIDAEIDGMVFGRPLIPPTRYGSSIRSIDDSAAQDIPGYRQTLILEDPSGTVPGWGMVIADSFHAASTAAALVEVDWSPGETAAVTEQALLDRGRELIGDATKGALVVDDEGVDAAFERAESVVEQSYTTGSVLHFQLEPVNALAFEKDGRWEIHTGNQWQSLALPALAEALGVPESDIVMRTYLIGGGFGRRLNGDYAVPAALAAKAVQRPVKMVLTREDDARFDSLRSPSNQTVRMAFDSEGEVIGMEHHAAAGWPTQAMAAFFMPEGKNGEKFDPFAIHGADHWYSVGAHRLRAVVNDLANATFRPGWLRSVGSGWVNWALECFIDEAALERSADPVEFRLNLLRAEGKNAGSAPNSVGGASRQARVLREVREISDWGENMPPDTGLGVATTFGQERDMPTWTACVARVRVERRNGRPIVEKLWLVTDAGTIVDPDSARAQVEGATLWGASMALHEGTQIEAGQVRDTNLNGYMPLRMRDVPDMDIRFIDSTATAVGLGEPATTVVGPAIGNAIYAAVGVRVRDLPIRADRIREALPA